MADQWKGMGSDLQSYGRRTVAITPGGTDLPDIPKTILACSGGDITVIPQNNLDAATVTFTGVSVGFQVPLIVRRVTASSATLVAVYD